MQKRLINFVAKVTSGIQSVCLAVLLVSPAMAAPTVDQALDLRPVHPGIEFDQPADKASCKLEPSEDASGWVLVDKESGQKLRRFLDTNGDKKLDQWCYYKAGNEVYRDIDLDKNGRADQYRWLGMAGTRWGIDQDEDGKIDRWKYISAEEVSSEIVEALKTKDRQRFAALLVSSDELKTLGLSSDQQKKIAKMTDSARKKFLKHANKTKIGKDSSWTNFSATRPGTIPAGNNGVTKDVIVYENAVAMFHNEGVHEQLVLGTLLKVNDAWRLTQLPEMGRDANDAAGIFFTAAHEAAPRGATDQAQSDAKTQKWLRELEKIDKAMTSSDDPKDITRLNEDRANVLEKIIAASPDEALRANWIHQLADTLSAAVQTGAFPEGTERLKLLIDRLQESATDVTHLPYVKFRYLSANYTQLLQDPDEDGFHKIQEGWLRDLEGFVNEYPKSQDTGEAMLQLALAKEFAGQDDKAKDWYARIVDTSGDKILIAKATGAKRRLDSVGQGLELAGKTLDGDSLSLSKYRGKVVALQFWATWCEPCLNDMKELKRLVARYGSQGFTPIGVNLDADKSTVTAFLKENRYPWPHMYENGGLDSRLANELGVLTLPTMLLINKRGKVINRSLHAGELHEELEKIFDK